MNILVTGSSGGFGRLIVTDLLAKGHKVAASLRDAKGRNAKAAAELRAEGASVVEIDVTDEASVTAGVKAAEAALGRIEVLVNNAGVGAHGIIENFTADDYRRLFDINVFGVQRMTRAVAPSMRARGEGLVVNISSLLGRITIPFYGPYNASKWALEAMTENWRTELSAFGVEFALVEPGGFPTAFAENLVHPSDRSRDAEFGDMAGAPEAALTGFMGMLAQNPQQDPKLVAEAVASVIAAPHGARPFRTEVDRIGMAEPVKGYNDHLAQVTAGLYAAVGSDQMLTVKTRAIAAE